ncbi:MAG: hypothetical protein ABW189_03805 [Rickettsiales bacterium]
MDKQQRKEILSQLASHNSDYAKIALGKEVKKIGDSLETENKYESIHSALELLEVIAYRVSNEAVDIIRKLLLRLQNIQLTYEIETQQYPEGWFLKFRNNNTLTVDALEILNRIRYYQINDILDIIFQYANHSDKKRLIRLNNVLKMSRNTTSIYFIRTIKAAAVQAHGRNKILLLKFSLLMPLINVPISPALF